MSADALLRQLRALDEKIARTARGNWVVGTVSATDLVAQTADVLIPGGTVSGAPVLGNYIPEVGHQVIVMMNGQAPIVLPPAQPLTSAPPAQASGLVVLGGLTSLLIDWAGLLDADVKWNRGYYQVQVDTANTFDSLNLLTRDVAGTGTTITKLTPDVTYYVRVRGMDYVGTPGDWSATSSGVPLAAGPDDIQANAIIASKIAAFTLEAGKYIRSTGYVPGVSGWNIPASGDAEFNGVILRGRADLVGSPELLANPGFEVDTAGWVEQASAKTWRFDTTDEGWTGYLATVAFESTVVYHPPGALKVIAAATSCVALAPYGALGQAVTPGIRYEANIPLASEVAGRSAVAQIRWYDSAGNQISVLDGSATTTVADKQIWRVLSVAGTAPTGAARGTPSITFGNGAVGDVHYVDEVGFSLPTNTALTRQTTEHHSGSAALRVRSLAAGVTLVGTPGVVHTGYPVTPGEFYYWRVFYKQTNGIQPLFVGGFLDANGVLLTAPTSQDTFGRAGTNTWQVYTAVWEVPPGAAQLVVISGFIATAANQDLWLDDASLTRMSTLTGGVWKSRPESGGPGQVFPAMTAWLRSDESGFPHAHFNGHVYHRFAGALLFHNGAAQTIPTGVTTTVVLDTPQYEAGGCVKVGDSVQVGRSAYYFVSGNIVWGFWLGGAAGSFRLFVQRCDAALTPLEEIGRPAFWDTGSNDSPSLGVARLIRLNAGERVQMRVLQTSGGNRDLQAGGFGAAVRTLSVLYAGDAA